MTLADHSDDSLIREIDEELRTEQFQKTWNRYGKMIIAAGVLLVAGVAGFQFWQKHDLDTRQALGDRFANAQVLAANGDITGAASVFKQLADEGGGYGLLARLQQAGLLTNTGNTAEALEIYAAIAADQKISEMYRGLATVLAASLEINDTGADTSGIRSRLAPLTTTGNPWRFTAKELSAALDLKEGKQADARAIYQELTEDAATPPALRERATEMLTILR